MVGPRFEQTAQEFQPRPLAAIELIAQEPIRLVKSRVAVCDGGVCRNLTKTKKERRELSGRADGGALGHPKIFINLDKEGAKACNYCGIRFEMDPEAKHHH